jgi:hypothetical protein
VLAEDHRDGLEHEVLAAAAGGAHGAEIERGGLRVLLGGAVLDGELREARDVAPEAELDDERRELALELADDAIDGGELLDPRRMTNRPG